MEALEVIPTFPAALADAPITVPVAMMVMPEPEPVVVRPCVLSEGVGKVDEPKEIAPPAVTFPVKVTWPLIVITFSGPLALIDVPEIAPFAEIVMAEPEPVVVRPSALTVVAPMVIVPVAVTLLEKTQLPSLMMALPLMVAGAPAQLPM